jgi:alpha-amylase/alpha-mannosidase (GH57 family)
LSDPLYITFMWHMHQPYYKDPLSGEYTLPWTYLHAVKDYFDMAAIVDEVPDARVVFNLAPSLLEQIVDYAFGRAVDPFLARGKMAPADMNEEDRLFIMKNFFSANRQRMIEPNKRYLELLFLAGDGDRARLIDRLRLFGDQEILDLQVWFFLAWTGEAARRRYPEFQELAKKGKNFTNADKDLLFNGHSRLLRDIIPLYRRLHDEGKAELSVSPYFHPILPLLCDMKSTLVAMPKANLPATRFKHPEDARSQVELGIARFEETFGFSPSGIWPSEGSISDEALAIIADCGFRWAASDEDVLARSIGTLGEGKERLYQPYLFPFEGGELHLFFRDHTLSDQIGFTYAQWQAERAVDDFVARLQEIRRKSASGGRRLVPVILDGENAWEYYPNNGHDFLTLLYEKIALTPGLEAITFSEGLAEIPAAGTIRHVHPGSWINASYGIWVGHPEENLGWDYLERAREATLNHSPEAAEILAGGQTLKYAEAPEDGPVQRACKSLYAAEGSDWFWWYGDDHFSAYSGHFDRLFRKNLMNVYRSLGLDIPRELFEPIKKETPAGLVREPASMITPSVNGFVDDYFEWLPAGLYDLSRQSSAMHASENLMQCFYYGYDRNAFYFRFDGVSALEGTLRREDTIRLHMILDREYLLPLCLTASEGQLLVKESNIWKETGIICRWKIARICEAMVPFAALNPEKGSKIFVYFTLVRDNDEIGRWPADAPMLLKYLGPDLELENWLI